jgi:hypothetical protein
MEIEGGTTRLSRAFCSARDRKIPILIRDFPDATDNFAPELLSCLDYGVRCTGWLCPLFPVPTLPPEDLLEEAIQAERDRKEQAVAEGREILERALREGREWRDEEARRKSVRGRPSTREEVSYRTRPAP